MSELQKLQSKVHFLKEANMVNAKERAFDCMHQMMVVLNQQEQRIKQLEKGDVL